MDRTHILVIGYWNTLLEDDITRIDLMLKHESSGTRLGISIHHSPVDWGSTTVLW
jgi:hypothetical protein